MKTYFATLARYNAWATRRLCEQVDAVPDDDYRRDVGLFFKSIHGTLNHLLVAEHGLWFRRFTEGVSPQLGLSDELEPDRHRLRDRLIEGATGWLPFIESIDEARWSGELAYVTTKGIPARLPFAAILGHVFNHGTHHRGQITAALTAMGRPGPELDLSMMLVAEQRAAAPSQPPG